VSALELAERALRAAEGDEALGIVHSERSGLARFAASAVHQPTLIENEVVELQIVRDGRLGIATANRTDDEGLRELAARASEAADSAPADPDFPGLAPPADPPSIQGFDEETAALGAEEQARLAAAAIEASELDLYGFFTSGVTELAIASTTGLRAHEQKTDATCLGLAAADGASGYAESTAWRAAELDPAAVAREAAAKADLERYFKRFKLRSEGKNAPDPLEKYNEQLTLYARDQANKLLKVPMQELAKRYRKEYGYGKNLK